MENFMGPVPAARLQYRLYEAVRHSYSQRKWKKVIERTNVSSADLILSIEHRSQRIIYLPQPVERSSVIPRIPVKDNVSFPSW